MISAPAAPYAPPVVLGPHATPAAIRVLGLVPLPSASVAIAMPAATWSCQPAPFTPSAIPMLLAVPDASVSFSQTRGLETERVRPLPSSALRSRSRAWLALPLAGAAILGVALGLVLLRDDTNAASASIESASLRDATSLPVISMPVTNTPIASEPAATEPAATEPAPATDADKVAIESTDSTPVTATADKRAVISKHVKPKKSTHRRRPVTVDSATPLGTLRVKRS